MNARVLILTLAVLLGCRVSPKAGNGQSPERSGLSAEAAGLVSVEPTSDEWTLHLAGSHVLSQIAVSLSVSDGRVGAVDTDQDAWVHEGDGWRRVEVPAPATHVASASAGGFVFGTADGQVCRYRQGIDRAECVPLPRRERIASLRVTNDTALVALPSGFALVDTDAGTVIASVQTPLVVGSMTLTDVPGLVRATNDAGIAVEWSTYDNQLTRIGGTPNSSAMSTVRWGARGQRLAIAEGRFPLLSVYRYGREVPEVEREGWAALLDTSDDFSVLAAVSGTTGAVSVYDATLRVRASLKSTSSRPNTNSPELSELDLSQDGRFLAVAYRDGRVDVYEVRRP